MPSNIFSRLFPFPFSIKVLYLLSNTQNKSLVQYNQTKRFLQIKFVAHYKHFEETPIRNMAKQVRNVRSWIDEVAPSPVISPNKPSTVPSLEPIIEETREEYDKAS